MKNIEGKSWPFKKISQKILEQLFVFARRYGLPLLAGTVSLSRGCNSETTLVFENLSQKSPQADNIPTLKIDQSLLEIIRAKQKFQKISPPFIYKVPDVSDAYSNFNDNDNTTTTSSQFNLIPNSSLNTSMSSDVPDYKYFFTPNEKSPNEIHLPLATEQGIFDFNLNFTDSPINAEIESLDFVGKPEIFALSSTASPSFLNIHPGVRTSFSIDGVGGYLTLSHINEKSPLSFEVGMPSFGENSLPYFNTTFTGSHEKTEVSTTVGAGKDVLFVASDLSFKFKHKVIKIDLVFVKTADGPSGRVLFNYIF